MYPIYKPMKYLFGLFFSLFFINLSLAKGHPDYLKRANKVLTQKKLYSVMNKVQIPPSGDKHDYMSQGPYWWPDPSKPDGKPYIRKDGERNPEIKNITDSDEMDDLILDVEALTEAYKQTKNSIYADFAAKLIKTWFIDPATKQSPNLKFSQGIPGINDGRGIGLIETRFLFKITDAATQLQGSSAWTATDHRQLKQWFQEFLTWMTTSEIGLDEADEHNNHGTYYDVQVIDYAQFTGQVDVAKKQVEVTKGRMASQLKPDGSQPHELARTKSFGYSLMNLEGFFIIAELAKKQEIDLFAYQTPEGASLKKCLDFLVPYIKKEKVWTYQQIAEIHWADTEELLRKAAIYYKDPAYGLLADQVSAYVPLKFSGLYFAKGEKSFLNVGSEPHKY